MSNFNNRGLSRGGFKGRRSPMGNDTVIPFRFLIPSKAAPIIIGPRGERIQRLMRECNSRLSIPDNKGPERLLLIDGTLDNCIKFWVECFPDLKDVMSSPSRKGGTEMDLRFLCHNSVVGAIIGKGGSKVKDMRTTYQLSLLKVHTDLAPLSTDRVLQIIGPPNKVFDCLKILFADLEEQMIRGPVDHYNPQNYDSKTSLSYGGWPPEGGWQFEGGDHNQSRMGRYEGNMNAPHDQFDGLRNGPPIDQYSGPRNMQDDPYDEPRNLPPMDPYGSRGGQQMEPFGGDRNAAPSFDNFGGSRNEPSMDQFKRPRNVPPFNQYGGPRDEHPHDQFGGPRNAGPHQIDQYDVPRITPLMDQFPGSRNVGHSQIDQYEVSRNDPPMDDYRGPRNMPPINQYSGSRNPEPLMDHYCAPRGPEPLVDQYGGPRNVDPLIDNYGGPRNTESSLDPYEGFRNDEHSLNNFGGPRNIQPTIDHYGGGSATNPYDSDRNARHSGDQYSGGRNVVPLLDSYNDEWHDMAPFGGGRPGPPLNQFTGRGVAPPPNQFSGNSRGGGPNSQFGTRPRVVTPLMEALDGQYGFDNGGEDVFKPSHGKGSFEDRRQIGSARRSLPDDRQTTFNKKPRTMDFDDKTPTNNTTPKAVVTSGGDVDVTIPSEYLSVLQGVGGEKLYNIMEDSGANIVIKPDDNVVGVRVLTLKGTKDQIEGAQYLMQMCIKRFLLKI